MVKGDTSVFMDAGGVEHVAVVTGLHTDGTVDLAVLKTSQRNVPRSAHPAPGMFYDPDWAEPMAEEQAKVLRQFTEGPDGNLREVLPVQPTAHGSPALVSVPEGVPVADLSVPANVATAVVAAGGIPGVDPDPAA